MSTQISNLKSKSFLINEKTVLKVNIFPTAAGYKRIGILTLDSFTDKVGQFVPPQQIFLGNEDMEDLEQALATARRATAAEDKIIKQQPVNVLV